MTQQRPDPSALPGWPRLLTLTLAAAYCGVSEEKFRGLVNIGALPRPLDIGAPDRWDLNGLSFVDTYSPTPPIERRWTEHDGVSGVYFIGFGDYVKIGVSASIGTRLRNLEHQFPRRADGLCGVARRRSVNRARDAPPVPASAHARRMVSQG